MGKEIISVGLNIPGESETYVSFRSDKSLLDADLIIIAPQFYYGLYDMYDSNPRFQGLLTLSESGSAQFNADSKHWNSEIRAALNDGKTVFVFLEKFEGISIFSHRDYSGTGRSRSTTNIFGTSDNYSFLPVEIPKLISKSGEKIIFLGHLAFSKFWNDFSEYLNFKCYMDANVQVPLFVTNTGKKPLGALFKVGKGNLVLLPHLEIPEEEFTTTNKKGEDVWNKKGMEFGANLIQCLIDIDKNLREGSQKTEPPAWLADSTYQLAKSAHLSEEIKGCEKAIQDAFKTKEDLLQKLEKLNLVQGLLFENGKQLEAAIDEAMGLLGYEVKRYDDGTNEFDHIFISPEGHRLLGETEGKENKAVNIDKLRQLQMNVLEDLRIHDLQEPAYPILFGNGFRQIKPENREEQFTEKCIKTARMQNLILIRCTDLFKVAQYLNRGSDAIYEKACRDAIINNRGSIVSFPTAPVDKESSIQ